jgi:hypothetical protein
MRNLRQAFCFSSLAAGQARGGEIGAGPTPDMRQMSEATDGLAGMWTG